VYSDGTDLTKFSKQSGAGVLSKMLNPKNFSSLRTLDAGDNTSRLYVESAD
jgi:hypothetical protein